MKIQSTTILLLLFVALATTAVRAGLDFRDIAGTYTIIESKCSRNVFSGCPYTKTKSNSDWMCPNRDSNLYLTCDKSNYLFNFRDDGYIYNSDIKVQITFDATRNLWVSKDSDITQLLYECGSRDDMKEFESQCGGTVNPQKQRIVATKNINKPCVIVLERVSSETGTMYTESLDKFGKQFTCSCGSISLKQNSLIPECSSGLLQTSCSQEVVHTDFGELICQCGRILTDSEGKYSCETGTLEVKYKSDFSYYSQQLSLNTSQYDDEGNEIESLAIDLDADIIISSQISQEKVQMFLGFDLINMKKVEVTSKKSTTAKKNAFLNPTRQSSSSASTSESDNDLDEVQFLYVIEIEKQLINEITELQIHSQLQRSIQTSPQYDISFDIFDNVAVKGIKMELENYANQLQMAHKKPGRKRFLKDDEENDEMIVKGVLVENGLVDMLFTEKEDEHNVILVKSYSESDFIQFDYDLGGDLPEIDHVQISQFDKVSGKQVSQKISHSIDFDTSDTNLSRQHLRFPFFNQSHHHSQKEESDEASQKADEMLVSNRFAASIDFQSNLSTTQLSDSDLEAHMSLFKSSVFSQIPSNEQGFMQLDSEFEIQEEFFDNEEDVQRFIDNLKDDQAENNIEEGEEEEEQQQQQQREEQSNLRKNQRNESKLLLGLSGIMKTIQYPHEIQRNTQFLENQKAIAKLWIENRKTQLKAIIVKLQEQARAAREMAGEIDQIIRQPYSYENYFQIRNAKFFGQKCEIGIGFKQENEISYVALIMKVNNFIQYIIREVSFDSCPERDDTLFDQLIDQKVFSFKYPIWGFVSTFVDFDMKFHIFSQLKTIFNHKSQTCQGKLSFGVTPEFQVTGGVKAFAVANIGLYGNGSFFPGLINFSIETWGLINNQGEANMSYQIQPFQYESGFFKSLVTCKFTWLKLFTFKKICEVGDSVSTPLYYNEFSQLSVSERNIEMLSHKWGELPKPTPKID